MDIRMDVISDFITNSLQEDCVNIANAGSSLMINFDKFRKDFEEGNFSSLRSVDFVELKERVIYLIEITNLRETAKSKRKEIKKEDRVRLKENSYTIKSLLKAEYREKLFESLFLLQILSSNSILDNTRGMFLIILCNSTREDVGRFRYLEDFLSSLLPENWNCKVILESSFRRLFIRR